MNHPPSGPGYGGRPHGSYGAPSPYGHGPQGPYGNGPPPRKSGSNTVILVVVVVALLFMVGGGGCLAIVLLASRAAGDGAATSADEPTTDGTPLAKKLEAALRNDGVPLDHVECPKNPPSPRSFSCAVLPSGVGDPAEVTVNNGASGMSYELQKGFVILDGAKLAATFASLGRDSRGLTVPCFRGKIMKHADTSMTCEVQRDGADVGFVTTQVIGASGDVKMDYAPSAKPSAATGTLDGRYACLTLSKQAGMPQYVPAPLPPFTISGGSYTASGKIGNFRTADRVALFLDGAYDGWQGLIQRDTSGAAIVFRGDDHEDAKPGVSVRFGDYRCHVQK